MPTTVTVKDSQYGSLTYKIPDGYRHVPHKEFAKRRSRCMRKDNWKDLENVQLLDNGKLMSISCAPYVWRCFVEKVS